MASQKEGSSFVLEFDEVHSAKSVRKSVDSIWSFFSKIRLLIVPVGLFPRYRLRKMQILFTLEYWIGVGIHMSCKSVGRIKWRYALSFYYYILFISFIIYRCRKVPPTCLLDTWPEDLVFCPCLCFRSTHVSSWDYRSRMSFERYLITVSLL